MPWCQFSTLTLSQAKKRQNDFGHDQYLIADLFEALNTQTRSYRKAYCRLGITVESWRGKSTVSNNIKQPDIFRLHRWHLAQEDIYPGEEWNYVFGQAKPMECLNAKGAPDFAWKKGVSKSRHGLASTPSMIKVSQLPS